MPDPHPQVEGQRYVTSCWVVTVGSGAGGLQPSARRVATTPRSDRGSGPEMTLGNRDVTSVQRRASVTGVTAGASGAETSTTDPGRGGVAQQPLQHLGLALGPAVVTPHDLGPRQLRDRPRPGSSPRSTATRERTAAGSVARSPRSRPAARRRPRRPRRRPRTGTPAGAASAWTSTVPPPSTRSTPPAVEGTAATAWRSWTRDHAASRATTGSRRRSAPAAARTPGRQRAGVHPARARPAAVHDGAPRRARCARPGRRAPASRAARANRAAPTDRAARTASDGQHTARASPGTPAAGAPGHRRGPRRGARRAGRAAGRRGAAGCTGPRAGATAGSRRVRAPGPGRAARTARRRCGAAAACRRAATSRGAGGGAAATEAGGAGSERAISAPPAGPGPRVRPCVTSPAPTVSRRSPVRTVPASTSAAADRSGRKRTRSARQRAPASATSAPVTAGSGSSRAT